MRAGRYEEGKATLRMKIDMGSPNVRRARCTRVVAPFYAPPPHTTHLRAP